MAEERGPTRNGKLSIPLPFEDALRAVLRVKPDAEQPAPKNASTSGKAPKAAPRRHGTAP